MPQSPRKRIERNSPGPAFGSTLSAILDEIYSIPSRQMYPAGVEIYSQGAAANDVYLLEGGLAKLVRIEPDGQELIFDLRYPGSLMGNFSAIINKPYPLTAITLVNSDLRRIPADHFRQLLQTDTKFSWHVHQMHCGTAFDHVLLIAQLGLTTARQRLEQMLWKLMLLQKPERGAKDLWLKIPLKYWEMAALIAVSPTYLSRLFGQLEQDGILLRKKGRLIIRNPQRLQHQAEA